MRMGPVMRATRRVYQTETETELSARLTAQDIARMRRQAERDSEAYTDASMRAGELGIGCRGAYGQFIEEEFPMLHGCDK